MKAIVYTEYGPPEVLHVEEMAKPVPKENEILIRVHAAPVNYGDLTARNFKNISPREFNMPLLLWLLAKLAFGLRKPRNPILGSEFAGVVEEAGRQVKGFQKGDPVFGYRGQNMGAYAEYLCMPEGGMVAIKPSNLTFEQAAAVPYGAITALSLLRKAGLKSEQKILIHGASGGIGSAAVQLAKALGAEVTGTCSTPRVELVRALGADRVLDYTREDFTQGSETYDLIFDILGRSSFSRCKRVLRPGGVYLLASFKGKQLLQMLGTRLRGDRKVVCAFSSEKPEDLIFLRELAEAGTFRPIIDSCYAMEQAAGAHRHAEQGQKKGSVIITLQNGG
jgi:NADPH:quinone reductase-like Zn-dependent oxidoreductase